MSRRSFFHISIYNYQFDGTDNGTPVEVTTLVTLAHMSSLRRGVDDQVIEARSKEGLSS